MNLGNQLDYLATAVHLLNNSTARPGPGSAASGRAHSTCARTGARLASTQDTSDEHSENQHTLIRELMQQVVAMAARQARQDALRLEGRLLYSLRIAAGAIASGFPLSSVFIQYLGSYHGCHSA